MSKKKIAGTVVVRKGRAVKYPINWKKPGNTLYDRVAALEVTVQKALALFGEEGS